MQDSHLQVLSSDLQKAFLSLKTKNDVFAFLRDLLTADEIAEFSLRLDIAKRLDQWQLYKDIEKATKASSTTVARVAKFLHWPFGWYKKVLR